VLDEKDLLGAEQLFGDNKGAECVAGRGARVADYVGVAEINAVGGCGIDSSVHTGYCWLLVRNWSRAREEDIPTAYFFAGGRASEPLVKLEAYFLLESTRFCWIGVAILMIGFSILSSL